MTTQVGRIPAGAAARRVRWSAERRFHLGFVAVIIAAVFLGFSRTFFLRPWFPEWAVAHGPPETFFYFHGALFVGWLLLLLAQTSLVTAGRVDLHRRLGPLGGVLAIAMVLVGTIGALTAAGRSTGFIDVRVPPLQFLAVPLADIGLFGSFVALALANRGNPQSHKRYMLLASLALVEAAVARWPFAMMTTALPVPGLSMTKLCVDLFLIPMLVWDIASRGRVHPVTLWGGVALIASQLLRLLLSQTHAWLAFAGWAVSLLPR